MSISLVLTEDHGVHKDVRGDFNKVPVHKNTGTYPIFKVTYIMISNRSLSKVGMIISTNF